MWGGISTTGQMRARDKEEEEEEGERWLSRSRRKVLGTRRRK